MNKDNALVVLWTTGDKITAKNMVLMYTLNSKLRGWWEDVTLIIWGASAELVAGDDEMQEIVKKIIDEGITVEACKACSDNLGVSGDLEDLGVEVRYMGEATTNYLKEGRHFITV